MTANKNDKADAKPAMQFVNPRIWRTIRLVERSEVDGLPSFEIHLIDLINQLKGGFDVMENILVLMAEEHGRTAILRECGMAMRAGEVKYGDWDFLRGHGRYQLYAAMERHALLIMDGEVNDVDTTERIGTPVTHVGCIVAGINMIWFQQQMNTSAHDGPVVPKEKDNGIHLESTSSITGATTTDTRKWELPASR